MQSPEDFLTGHATIVENDQNQSYSFTSVNILPELIGKPWNDISMVYVMSLNPSAIRVSSNGITLDSYNNRITVNINNNKEMIIEKITKEVKVYIPDDINNAHCLAIALNKGKESKEFRFHNQDNIKSTTYGFGNVVISFHDDKPSIRWSDFE